MELEVDPALRTAVNSRQVVSCWILNARYMGQDEVGIEVLVTVIPQCWRYSFGLNNLVSALLALMTIVGFFALHKI